VSDRRVDCGAIVSRRRR